MKKIEIFDDIVSIMAQDSSTKKDLKGADPLPFRKKITDEMTDEDFFYLVRSYLASFGIIGHVSFRRKGAKSYGFLLRSTQDGLFVESANEDTQLQAGDQILELDDQALEDVFNQHQSYFTSVTVERHYREWADLLIRASTITLRRQGQLVQVRVLASQQETEKQFFWKKLDASTVYLRLDDFMNEQRITQLYQESMEAICQSENLVIDVRYNAGGSDSLYFPLLHLALPEGVGYSSIDWRDEGMEILYSERNVDLRLAQFQEWLQQEGVSEETKAMLGQMSQALKANRGKGFVRYESEEGEFFPEITGQSYPKQIYVLSDIYCGSSGDNFVEMMQQFPKVTVVGRPTLGILDYSNCCEVDYGDYIFMFPTSRNLSIDKGLGMTDRGVQPDVVVPWTVEHLSRDVDLAVCRELEKGM